jgi:aldose sugar dehydrogenase
MISVYKNNNNNIIFTVVDIAIVVLVVFAGATLLTLGNIITTVNPARPALAQKLREQNQNENVVLPAAANITTTTTSSASAPPIPIINDSNLKAEVVFKGIEFPTSMAFLGPNDILVLEKNNGTVRRIVNGVMLPDPLLDVNVANKNERGMLGIAVSKHHNNNGPTTYVFLYYTEASGGKADGTDDCSTATRCNKANNPLGNRLYRYELVGNKLVNPKLLLDLPSTPGPSHNGGKIVIGPADNNLYVVIGEVTLTATQASNRQKGLAPDGRGGILRITQDGQAVGGEGAGVGVLGNSSSSVRGGNLSKLNLYYAYGIRNSFGIDFDPVTGNLWDSENGPSYGDEINLVYPGFNSGWRKVQGIWEVKGDFRGNVVSDTDNDDNNNKNNNNNNSKTSSTNSLVGFGGKGKYSVPKFVWNNTVAPTAVKFLSSSKLGAQYQNDLFVGDANNGNIYHFDLNENKNRTELVLKGPLTDKVADNISENKDIIWAKGFRIITDIQVGPYDGYLYVLSLNLPHDRGTIYRIVPRGE